MTPGLSILVPVSDKGNEGPYLLLSCEENTTTTFSLFSPPSAHFPFPSSASSPHSFLSAYFLFLRLSFPPSLCLLRPSPSPSLIGSPPPRSLARFPLPPPPFFSVPPSLCLLESIRHQGSKQGRCIRVDGYTTRFW